MSNLKVYDFGRDKSAFLKAFLPFLIIIHHCACIGVPHLGPMKLAGVTVCTWFFLVSGYGLMASFEQKGDAYLSGFIKKRLSKIMIPYIVAFVVYVVWQVTVEHVGLTAYFVSQNFDHWLPYSWFIFVIMGGYLLFYLTLKYLPTRIALCAFISISIGYIVVLNLLDVPRYWYGGSLGIAIGIMWRWYEGKIRSLLRSNTISIILFCSAVVLWVVFSKYIQFKEFHPLFTSTMLIVLIHRAPFPKNGSLVRFLSRISFELYLFQALAMRIVFDYLGFNPSWYAMALLLLTDIVISAIFRYGLIQPILTKLTK